MNQKLIIPKQTAQLDAFYSSLAIYYKAYQNKEEWHSNADFKKEIIASLPYLSLGAQDSPYLVKQSEMTRYFGLVFYDYTTSLGRAHITDRGIRFYNAYLQNDKDLQKDIIMESILNDNFGRNNTAIKSSDSNIDPPKLFIRSIIDLNGITRLGFAYLLYITNNLDIAYGDAVCELRIKNPKEREIQIPLAYSNKYGDVKFTAFLTNIGICEETNQHVYLLSDYTRLHYYDKIKKLQIYNKKPALILTLNENLESEDDDSSGINKETQNNILSAFIYDINSEKFKQQNNRVPTPYKKGNTIRFKTNARIAKTALAISNYKCAIDPKNHNTFTSKEGVQYMEAHHLIPMCAQKDYKINLDRVENIVSICPTCHSAVHVGDDKTRLNYLKTLYDGKIKELDRVGLHIDFGDLYSKYYQ